MDKVYKARDNFILTYRRTSRQLHLADYSCHFPLTTDKYLNNQVYLIHIHFVEYEFTKLLPCIFY